MPREKKRAKKRNLTIWPALIVPLIIYLISFWGDISQTLVYLLQIGRWLIVGYGKAFPTLSPEVFRSIEVVLFTLGLGYGATFLIWLVLMSFQALLPVETLDEVYETASHLVTHITGRHGPAIHIVDGKSKDSAEEMNRPGPGVIVVNFNSAVVLETQVHRVGCLMMPAAALDWLVKQIFHTPEPPASRVVGPGVVFISPAERIRAQVDLRRQTRGTERPKPEFDKEPPEQKANGKDANPQPAATPAKQTDEKAPAAAAKAKAPPVSAYTRDGIEVKAGVSAVFTIGQRPDVLELAYQGERRIENLKVITTRKVGKNLVQVRTADDELEPDDLSEAHKYAHIPNQKNDAQPYKEVEPARMEPEFDEDRVFRAVYAQARNAQPPQKEADKDKERNQENIVPWTELPVEVAADLFRSEIARFNYNDLYQLDSPSPSQFPLPGIRKRFRLKLRNNGLLWFRVVFHRQGKALVDGIYREEDLLVSPYLPFTANHVLRERGIKMVSANFSNPMPEEYVYKQRLKTWQASWEQETERLRAEYELEAARARNHARAQAQLDLANSLSEIFNEAETSNEVMTLRILQALEGVAADPQTRKLLPMETVNMMDNLHKWLLPGDHAGKDNSSPGGPPGGVPPSPQPGAASAGPAVPPGPEPGAPQPPPEGDQPPATPVPFPPEP